MVKREYIEILYKIKIPYNKDVDINSIKKSIKTRYNKGIRKVILSVGGLRYRARREKIIELIKFKEDIKYFVDVRYKNLSELLDFAENEGFGGIENIVLNPMQFDQDVKDVKKLFLKKLDKYNLSVLLENDPERTGYWLGGKFVNKLSKKNIIGIVDNTRGKAYFLKLLEIKKLRQEDGEDFYVYQGNNGFCIVEKEVNKRVYRKKKRLFEWSIEHGADGIVVETLYGINKFYKETKKPVKTKDEKKVVVFGF